MFRILQRAAKRRKNLQHENSINSNSYLSIQRQFKGLILHSPQRPRRVTKTNLESKQCNLDTNWILSKYRSSVITTLSCFIVCVYVAFVYVFVFVSWGKVSGMLCLDLSRLPKSNIKFNIALKFKIANNVFQFIRACDRKIVFSFVINAAAVCIFHKSLILLP